MSHCDSHFGEAHFRPSGDSTWAAERRCPLFKEELAELSKKFKPFKTAYNDLKAMSKAAFVRGQKAMEQDKKTIAAEKKQNAEARAAKDDRETTKRRRQEMSQKNAAADVMFTLRHSIARQVDVVSLTSELRLPAATTVDFELPVIFRTPPTFLQEAALAADLNACKSAFTDSAAKSTHGRAIRPTSQATRSPLNK